MKGRLPVVVVSGFVGSGKTTFLRYLINNTEMKFGLIINEFGDVGFDGDLIKNCDNKFHSSDCLIELNNGCLCCTVQDDFIPSIQSLLASDLNIDLIVIETSGLALPIPLLKALNWPEIRTKVYLDLVITIVNGESMINGSPINDLYNIDLQYKETSKIDHKLSIDNLFDEQLEVSDLVLISRSDLIKKRDFEKIHKMISSKISSNVPIISSFNGEVNLEILFDKNLKKNNYQKFIEDEHDHNHEEIFSETLNCDYFLDKNQFEHEMNQILKDLNILRIKGRVWIPGKSLPLQVQIVGRKINTWFEAVSSDRSVVLKDGGMDLVLIGFEKDHLRIFKEKIKEKFNISNVPK